MSVISVKTNEDKKVELEISVEAEVFGKAVDAAFKKNASRMQIPGFRRGKAPRKMIEKMYGESVFYEEAVNNTYPAAYEAAVEEKGIEPVDRADIEVLEVGKDGYKFKATVTVKPEVSLEGYKGIEVEKKLYEVTEEEINAQLERQREQNARVIPVEGRAAQDGDTATIDFEGSVDGVAFEGGKGENYPLVLGSNSFIPGFEEQVTGHSVGDSFEVSVTFPEDYHAEDLKGKAAVFKCRLEELKADIKVKTQERKNEQSQTEVENRLMELVAEKMVAEIPDCMYEARVDEMVRDFEYRLQSQGMDLKTYLQYTGMELSSFRKTFLAQAQAQVKTRLALEKIVELEKIGATQEEIDKELEALAKNYGMELDKIKSVVSVKEVSKSIAMNKALDLVRESAVIKEVSENADQQEKAAPPAKKTRSRKAKEEQPAE